MILGNVFKINLEIINLNSVSYTHLVRKVLETLLFQALGIIETLDSIISHGTLKKFADVRTHLRKVFDMTLS